MLPIKTLLVVLQPGRDKQAVWSQALAWARTTGARLEALTLVAPDVKPGLSLAPGLREMARHSAETQTERWLDALLATAPANTGHTVVVTDDLTEAVLHEARRLRADLIMVAAKDDAGNKSADNSSNNSDSEGQNQDSHNNPSLSVSQTRNFRALLRQSPCPVLLVRRDKAPQQFAAALALGGEDVPHHLLNQTALEHLVLMARSFQGRAHVLSALPNPVDLVPLMGDAYSASYTNVDLESRYRANFRRLMTASGLSESALTEVGLTENTLHMAMGRPDSVLPELAKANAIDCLLLGTVARKGFSAFWLGNTAEDVFPLVACDVLLLRPQDYFEPD